MMNHIRAIWLPQVIPKQASGYRHCFAAFLLITCAAHSPVIATIQEYRSPVTFQATASIDPGANIVLEATESGLPLLFVLEIQPVGGVVSLEVDGDVIVSWDDSQVGVGQTFNAVMSLAPGASDTIGSVAVGFAYQVQAGYEIDFDGAFHDQFNHWGAQAPDVQSYLIEGTRRGGISTGTNPVPEVYHEARQTLIAGTDSLFLLADTCLFAQQRVDTLPLTFNFEPYPCVRVAVTGDLYTYLQYGVNMDDLCARYAPPSDTLCWASTEPLSCLTEPSGQIQFQIPVACEAVKDYTVPICPIKASGSAGVSLRSELVVSNLALIYSCDPPGPLEKGDLDTLANSSPVTTDSTWYNQTAIALETDRDDAIFTVPVPLSDMTLTIYDGPTPLQPGDFVYDGSQYLIVWSDLDSGLRQCCANDEEVMIVYRAADIAQPDSSLTCSEVIATMTNNSSYFWSPAVGCAPSGTQPFVVVLEFSCPASGAVLFRTRSDTLRYSK
jgi:hypothetical protein